MSRDRLLLTASILKDLNAHWTPHDAQKQILRALFKDDCRRIFAECGRKFGKSETIAYIMVRWALLHPNAAVYYIAPHQRQAKEIIWANQRMQQMVPKKFIKSINNTEMRITLTNGSFIKCDGSENYESHRGTTPDLVALDEIKDFHPGFFPAMMPNLAVRNAPLIIIGTPPEAEGLATELRDEYKRDEKKHYFNFPSSCNPYISKEWLEEEKASLFAKGEEDTWYREYEAKFVRGGKNSIFPMLKEEHFIDEYEFVRKTKKDWSKMKWVVAADPGSSSCFAVVFLCINPTTKEVWVVDEIYEKNPNLTTTDKINSRISLTISKWNPTARWTKIYDEAAAWFYNEMSGLGENRGWMPTEKAASKRDDRTGAKPALSLIKDCLLQGKIKFIDHCEHLRWEMFNYIRKVRKDGTVYIPKKDDHLIDCLRYALLGCHYRLETIHTREWREEGKPSRGMSLDDYVDSLHPGRKLFRKYKGRV